MNSYTFNSSKYGLVVKRVNGDPVKCEAVVECVEPIKEKQKNKWVIKVKLSGKILDIIQNIEFE